MTPTLMGRWQTRLLLLGTSGLIISALFGVIFGLIFGWTLQTFLMPLIVLGYVALFGLFWDILYQFTLSFRWDQDWPTVFQVAAGIIEGILVWLLIHFVGLPGVDQSLLLSQFIPDYACVWLSIFIISQGPLRVVLPRWRYRGGQWI
jgi:hypothetical protein